MEGARPRHELDLEVELSAVNGTHVVAVRSPAGDARQTFEVPALSDMRGAGRAGPLRDVASADGEIVGAAPDLRDLGARLFEAIFTGDAGKRFEAMRHQARTQGRTLRIRFRIVSSSLEGIPWEAMYDASRKDLLALSTDTLVSRCLEVPEPTVRLVSPPLRILGVLSSPTDLPPLDVAAERAGIEEKMRDARARGAVDIAWITGANADWPSLVARLNEPRGWNILHFVGHGRRHLGRGQIAFANELGVAEWMDAEEVATALRGHAPLRLVTLNCCRSGEGDFDSVAASLVRAGVAAVVAMRDVISDAGAIAFAVAFYRALVGWAPVDAAVVEGRRAMQYGARGHASRRYEWAVPVLHMRSVDGRLFADRVQVAREDASPRLPSAYRWAFVIVATACTAISAAPLVSLVYEQPHLWLEYVRRYPALFVFWLFLPLAFIGLFRATFESWRRFTGARVSRRRRTALLMVAVFLFGVPAYATLSERYKQWVAPWEVVPNAHFVEVERYGGLPQEETAWPAAFFHLWDTYDPASSTRDAARDELQHAYARLFDNRRVLDGTLALTRTGVLRYAAVVSTSFGVALALANIALIAAHRVRVRSYRIPREVFRGLALGVICFAVWILMRLPTMYTDAALFGQISLFEQAVPAVTAIGASLALVVMGVRDHLRSEWFATFVASMGAFCLVLSFVARHVVARLFCDVRTYGACGLVLLLLFIFLIVGAGDASASADPAGDERAPPSDAGGSAGDEDET